MIQKQPIFKYKIRAYNDKAWYEAGIYKARSKEEAEQKCRRSYEPLTFSGLKLEISFMG